MEQKNISIREEFRDEEGRFQNYDAIPQTQRAQLAKQKHTNIRSFVQLNLTTTAQILYLDQLSMTNLASKQMQDLEGLVVVRYGEQWTNGTVAKQADRNQWNGISLSCTAGVTTTQSVIVI